MTTTELKVDSGFVFMLKDQKQVLETAFWHV